jgi:3-hydroxyisobutyrate dehydrogenase
VKHFLKDMQMAIDECEKMGIYLPGLNLAKTFYEMVKTNGGENNGTQSLILALEKLNNIQLPKS